MTDTADGPKIGISISNFDDSTLRRVRQLGITTVHSSGGIPSPNTNFGLEKHLPWTEKMLGSDLNALNAHGMRMGAKMITGFPKAIYGRPGRDEEIEAVIESVKVAALLEIPVIEYNWYVHRATEGYYLVEGRGGSRYRAIDYKKVEGLPQFPD